MLPLRHAHLGVPVITSWSCSTQTETLWYQHGNVTNTMVMCNRGVDDGTTWSFVKRPATEGQYYPDMGVTVRPNLRAFQWDVAYNNIMDEHPIPLPLPLRTCSAEHCAHHGVDMQRVHGDKLGYFTSSPVCSRSVHVFRADGRRPHFRARHDRPVQFPLDLVVFEPMDVGPPRWP